MTDNEKLIESVRDYSTITRMAHITQVEKIGELRDALIAAEKAHTPTQGSCWDAAPSIGHDPMPARCELTAGHLGAHRSGATEWMHGTPTDDEREAAALVDAVMGAMDQWSVNANLDGDDEPGPWVPRSRIEAAIDSVPLLTGVALRAAGGVR